jgi:hypothetical protein
MTRDLDPKLQTIIENATNKADYVDIGRPAISSIAGGRNTLGDSSSGRNGQDGFKFLSAVPPSAFELDDFGM